MATGTQEFSAEEIDREEAAHRREIITSLQAIRKKHLEAIDDIESDPLTAWTAIIEALEAVSFESYEAGYAAGRNAAVPTAS